MVILTVLDQQLNELGIIKNAYQISYERHANELSYVSFSLPQNDPKNELCKHFNYINVEGGNGRYYGKFRIMPTETKQNERDKSITYQCEHVLATLLDDVILDYHQFTNVSTQTVLKNILSMQSTEHWILGFCDFERYFHYGFENENGLLAPILSVPKAFNEPYIFETDTQNYPWTLHLRQPSSSESWDIIWGRDMKDFNEVADPTDIVNRIFPKGYGEGVNQLTIESVNNNIPYLEDETSINEWGLHSYIWIDRRFNNDTTLKAQAEALLSEWKDPKISFSVDSVDLSIKDEFKHLKRPFYTLGNIHVNNQIYQARIIGERIRDLSKEYEVEYDINNKIDDIATTQANVERKIQVQEAYSQGATNIDSRDFMDNCSPSYPAIIRFPIPDDVVNINEMLLTFETTYFRAFAQAIEGGGGIVTSTSGGGGFAAVTESGGGTVASSSAENYRSGTDGHNHGISDGTMLSVSGGGSVTFQASGQHDHNVSIPNHTHEVQTANHTHDIELPDHTHEIEYGIFENGGLPNSITIEVDGNELPVNDLSGQDIDLVPYLSKGNDGRISRGRYAEIKITPDDLARINMTVTSRLFIQSRSGGKF